MYAVGIDLAWSPRNPTGIAVASLSKGGWRLRRVTADPVSNEEILAEIEGAVGEAPAVLAIDAPLVVPHWTRGRDGDRMITRVFGPFDAGVYPATKRTIGRYGGERIWRLVDDLTERGFLHDCRIPPRRPGRYVFETYPHAATVALFRLPRILKYKARQGRTNGERIEAFRELERRLRSLRRFEPALDGVGTHFIRDVGSCRGAGLKDYEDRLDAILCAYIAAYYWTWGTRRCAIFGSLEGGYIVTPFSGELAARVPTGDPVVTYEPRRP